jgi:hypothetical protein
VKKFGEEESGLAELAKLHPDRFAITISYKKALMLNKISIGTFKGTRHHNSAVQKQLALIGSAVRVA